MMGPVEPSPPTENVIGDLSLSQNFMFALNDKGTDGGGQESTGDRQLPLQGDDADGDDGGHSV